jgi:hypothetical protein
MSLSKEAGNLSTFSEEILKCLYDPISLELISDPVMTDDNLTYDRETIQEWFAACRRNGKELTSPVTNQRLKTDELRPNLAMKTILEATMKYLSSHDELGLLDGKLKEALDHYRNLEREKALELTRKQDYQRRILNLPLQCESHHQMKYQKDVPNQYRGRFTNPTVNCNNCSNRFLERDEFYYNCSACEYDLCCTCAVGIVDGTITRRPYATTSRSGGDGLNLDEFMMQQQRNNQLEEDFFLNELLNRSMSGEASMHRRIREQQFHLRSAAGDRQRPTGRIMGMLGNMMSSMRRGSNGRLGEESGNNSDRNCPQRHALVVKTCVEMIAMHMSINCDRCGRTNIQTDRYVHSCRACDYDVCSRCLTEDNTAIVATTGFAVAVGAPLPRNRTCDEGHILEHIVEDLPPGYTSVRCNLCRNRQLESNPQGFLHCQECQYDLCASCASR